MHSSSDLDSTANQHLAVWLHNTAPQLGTLRQIRKFAGGQSNPTYLLDCAAGKCVLRRRPFGHLLPKAHMIEREFRVMSALQGSGVAVPRMLGLCDDITVIGATFYIMEFIEGRIFWDPAMPDCTRKDRGELYAAVNETVSRLHLLKPSELGLDAFGRPDGFMSRQVRLWTQQYRAAETQRIAAMDSLIAWLPEQLPQQTLPTCVFHGDLRLDNMIFDPVEPRVVAVLDWELSTLGDPLSDLAYHLITWRIPAPLFRGLGGVDLEALGIPREETYRDQYFQRTGFQTSNRDWTFYLAFSLFRLAAILQGVAKRAQEGNASAADAAALGAKAGPLAEIGWAIARGGG